MIGSVTHRCDAYVRIRRVLSFATNLAVGPFNMRRLRSSSSSSIHHRRRSAPNTPHRLTRRQFLSRPCVRRSRRTHPLSSHHFYANIDSTIQCSRSLPNQLAVYFRIRFAASKTTAVERITIVYLVLPSPCFCCFALRARGVGTDAEGQHVIVNMLDVYKR